MNSDRGHIVRAFIAILLLVGLANISSCKWGNWDLFGGDPVNQDGSGGDGDSGGNGGNNGNGSFTDFPPAVFTANIGGTKINEPVELFASFSNGSDITALTGVINVGGSGTDFKVSPDGTLVAYLFQKSNVNFELRVVPVEGGDSIRISQALSDNSNVIEFNWSPNSSRIAYLADDLIDGRFELYTNLAEGDDNIKVSDDFLPPIGGRVQAFEWAPDSSRIAYTADQNILGEFRLFSTPPNQENSAVQVSGTILPNEGGVTEFGWSPGSSRIAYLSDQRLSGVFELFTSLPDGGGNVSISGVVNVLEFAWAPDTVNESIAYSTERQIFTAAPDGSSHTSLELSLPPGGSISEFAWAPDSTRIAYLADQNLFGIIEFELFTVEPDGSNNIQVSGALTNGGNVTDFVWSPDSRFIAYRADQDSVLIFELYVTPPDVSESDTKVSGDMILTGSVEPIFSWSPDSARVAYRANQITANAIELFTSTPDGQTNDRVSGNLISGGNVLEFRWAPDNSGIGYIADQESNEFFELFASTPDGGDTAILSGAFAEAGDVLFFEWVPEPAEPDPNNP